MCVFASRLRKICKPWKLLWLGHFLGCTHIYMWCMCVMLCSYLSPFPTINALTITGVTDRLVGSIRMCFRSNDYLYPKFWSELYYLCSCNILGVSRVIGCLHMPFLWHLFPLTLVSVNCLHWKAKWGYTVSFWNDVNTRWAAFFTFLIITSNACHRVSNCECCWGY